MGEICRTPIGTFAKGKSGNPRGRPKKDLVLSEIAREHSEEAIETIVKVMRESRKGSERVQAACILLDRAYGKAPQKIENSGGLFQPVLNIQIVDTPPAETMEEWQARVEKERQTAMARNNVSEPQNFSGPK